MAGFLISGLQTGIRRPRPQDCEEFLERVRTSRELHQRWVDPPVTAERFAEYLATRDGKMNEAFLVCEKASGKIAGVVNINAIVRGLFQSGYLGYYGFSAFARQGLMAEGLGLVARYVFTELSLHRLEANIQPENVASIGLVKKLGFRLEGFSPRYLKIAGQWRDHQRWALLADDPKPSMS